MSVSLPHLVMDVFGKAALALAAANPDGLGTALVAAPRLHEALHAAVDSTTEFGDRGIEFCSQSLEAARAKLAAVATAIQNGEFDFDGSREEKAVPPILLRAEDVKAEIREATGTNMESTYPAVFRKPVCNGSIRIQFVVLSGYRRPI